MRDLLEIADELERQANALRRIAMAQAAGDDAGDEDWPQWRELRLQKQRLRDPRWPQRGRLVAAIDDHGGRVSRKEFMAIAARCGYTDGRSVGGFFSGKPPVFRDEGNDVVLTKRGAAAAAFWRDRFAA